MDPDKLFEFVKFVRTNGLTVLNLIKELKHTLPNLIRKFCVGRESDRIALNCGREVCKNVLQDEEYQNLGTILK